MAENGIPAWILLSKAMGKPVSELMKMGEQGKLLSSQVLPVLINQMNKDFAGGLQNASSTFSGMLANMKDTSDQILGTLFAPLFNSIKENLPAVQTALANFQKDLESGGIKQALSNLIPDNLQDQLSKIQEFTTQAKTLLSQGDWQGLGSLIGQKIGEGLTGIGQYLIQAASSIDWFAMGSTIGQNALGFALGLVDGLLNTDFIGLFADHWDDILLMLVSIIALPEAWAVKLATALAKIPFVGKMLGQFVKWINELGKPLWEKITGFLSKLGSAFVDGFKIGFKGQGLISFIAQPFVRAFNFVKNALTNFKNNAMKAIDSFLVKFGYNIGLGLGKVRDSFVQFLSWIGQLFSKMATSMIQAGKDLIGGLINGLVAGAKKLYNKAKEIANTVTSTIKKAFDINSPSRVMMEIGGFVTKGLAIGMEDMKPLDTSVSAVTGNIIDPIRSAGGSQQINSGATYNINVNSPEQKLTEKGLLNMLRGVEFLYG